MSSDRIALLLGGLLGASGVWAHHAATGLYDNKSIGEVEGEVTSVFWRNPHVRLRMTGSGEHVGEDWAVEFGSVNTLERIGVSADMVHIGDHVKVSGRLGRNGLKAMFGDSITLANGQELILVANEQRRYGITEEALSDAKRTSADERADIFRVWLPNVRPHTGDGGTRYPLTPAARAKQAQWVAADDPALRCIPPGLPTAMDNPYPVQFIDQGDSILMLLEEWDGRRVFHMNGTGTPEQPPSRMGYSVGRWEGRTLVVETRDIDWRYIDDLGTPQSEDVVIVERYTLNEDGTRLAWEAQITDPVNFTAPVIMDMEWVWVPGHEIKPYNCTLPDAAQ